MGEESLVNLSFFSRGFVRDFRQERHRGISGRFERVHHGQRPNHRSGRRGAQRIHQPTGRRDTQTDRDQGQAGRRPIPPRTQVRGAPRRHQPGQHCHAVDALPTNARHASASRRQRLTRKNTTDLSCQQLKRSQLNHDLVSI